eukprot:gb/GECG01004069.1/.p1 GENE.gb/GECG01004069.1/~~gb/GECG01004069.1/.p1  ORF type:complete len:144 (+),score=10.03 gb/GECG01004069.1/:1-432(+)
MSTNKSTSSNNTNHTASSARKWPDIMSMALEQGAQYEKSEFPELLDVIYWARQILAVFLGVIVALSGAVGAPAILSYVVANFLIVMVYIRGYLGIEVGSEETEWSTKELLTSGFMPSFGLYLVRIHAQRGEADKNFWMNRCSI